MKKCPPEVLAIIFAYACSEDGTTGRSLSLVSHYIHAASSPFQWQSLSISGIRQARGFAAHVFAAYDLEPRHRRPIHHLFLSTRTCNEAHDSCWPGSPCDDWPLYQSEILRYAAPTLQTLTFVAFDPFFTSAHCIEGLLRVPLPVLSELTVRARCTPSQVSLDDIRDDKFNDDRATVASINSAGSTKAGVAWCARPQLRRLHLACSFHGFVYGTDATHALVRAFSPVLTHLRLSMLDMWGSKRVAEVLHAECVERDIVPQILALPPLPTFASASSHPPLPADAVVAQCVTWARVLPSSPPHSHPHSSSSLPSSLRSTPDLHMFAIQPPPTAASDFFCSCCMDVRGDADVMRVFAALAHEAQMRHDARFLYLPTREKEGYGFREARTDWLDRVGGGAGCWAKKTSAAWEETGRIKTNAEETQVLEKAEEDRFAVAACSRRGSGAAEGGGR
ncbi:uncharacterized protein LAESUDRAFT_734001 [Laetiporus sulphureus 93-53]|uniref:Uncharacterized protein n=1 Tax=Laetiporus sulphureus 93-53 TaxID=1314785 RepID=A0A165HUK4_9APHY|nr:uncharacterized protein LAESUDRAFT_734001 [Laetiporus sulphureus 93-53]KZT12207.1 hypothetical protein LAESUDRAFT_734001 [Laetiporus sulphureus 93-53]